MWIPAENIQHAKPDFEPHSGEVSRSIAQTVGHVVLEMIVGMTRGPDEKRIAGWVTKEQIGGALVFGLRVEANQAASPGFD
jgi:hypothetical protein